MAEPKDKNSPEWRKWFVRNNIIIGPYADVIEKALQNKKNRKVAKKYLRDIEQANSKSLSYYIKGTLALALILNMLYHAEILSISTKLLNKLKIKF